ncbi:MAG: type I restriction endonuclease subunit R [Thermoguttaceae bacterium]|nr:type I restriction endonuclease subunit R [Thermoguttaceae bacterium]
MLRLVAENPESTVVAEYEPLERDPTSYQSEAELEEEFIAILESQGYERLRLKNEAELVANLRRRLEALNDVAFTDAEWERLFKQIANPAQGVEEKTAILQENHVLTLQRDDGSFKNIALIDKTCVCNNFLQVVNQYAVDSGVAKNRYDVTILVNGLPLVCVELKRRGVAIKEAFNQIDRYCRDSFWAGRRLFEFVQIFVISNGTHTKYYSNTTRQRRVKESERSGKRSGRRSSASFEFTSWWADARNRPIGDLVDFARTFFAKRTILNVLTRFCVFTSERVLLAMRPYQIVATERILQRMRVAYEHKLLGKTDAGGYVWHTTGSGKTLTSFKTAQLASKLDFVDKTLFVVDRKDLDHQTMEEYDRFQKGAAKATNSASDLGRKLADPEARIIVTTIQKLALFVAKNPRSAATSQNVAFVFDECHRSQFGEMRAKIAKAFRNHWIFGFTGTPIFTQNAVSSKVAKDFRATGKPIRTTEEAFGERLHAYTIVDAIRDQNVLPFRVDYVRTMKAAEEIESKEVVGIDRESALLAPERIEKVVAYVLENFDRHTKRNVSYKLKDRRLTGFNSIFATASVPAAIRYYEEFKRQIALLPSDKRLKIATIFSCAPNEDADSAVETSGLLGEENSDSAEGLDKTSREALDAAIADYNATFNANFNSGEGFANYYKNLSQRVKEREVDLLIVVNMFLTGFDATTLNTLWVDKNLRYHGLLQAFSRTNRILNSVKTFGNVVCFRDLEQATNDCLALFGDSETSVGRVAKLGRFEDYYFGQGDPKNPGYVEAVERLREEFPLDQPLEGESAQKEFIALYGVILKLRNILQAFDEFAKEPEQLSERDFQDYQSRYFDLYERFRGRSGKRSGLENVEDDIVFELELAKQIEVTVDYILELIRRLHNGAEDAAGVKVAIRKAMDASVDLRDKRELIEDFIADLNPNADFDESWRTFVTKRCDDELSQIVAEERLDRAKTLNFVRNAFRDGYVEESGTGLAELLPRTSRFARRDASTSTLAEKKESVFDKLSTFLRRFRDIVSAPQL